MCRLFAVRADRPVRVEFPLVSAPHALQRQSCCDRSGRCHDSGWGIGFYSGEQPRRVRSARPAGQDPQYRATAEAVTSPTVVAHVRLASMGSVAERNCHPFAHGRWLFAHNGTLHGFDADPDRLRRLIPAHLRGCLQGETDSEHIFYLLLGRLEEADGSADVEAVGRLMGDTLRQLAELFPGTADDPTRLNCVLTDGELLVAARWGHSLYFYYQFGPGPVAAADGSKVEAVAVASEPVTEERWHELPDRSLLCVNANLTHSGIPILT